MCASCDNAGYCQGTITFLILLCLNVLKQDARNTIGNIPVEWYNDYPHIGYNLHGKRILKPATADEVGTIHNFASHLQ